MYKQFLKDFVHVISNIRLKMTKYSTARQWELKSSIPEHNVLS